MFSDSNGPRMRSTDTYERRADLTVAMTFVDCPDDCVMLKEQGL